MAILKPKHEDGETAAVSQEPGRRASARNRAGLIDADQLLVCSDDLRWIMTCKKVPSRPTAAIEQATIRYYELHNSRF